MKKVLRAIDCGETVTVFYRGKATAKLTPTTPSGRDGVPKMRGQPPFGLWKGREDISDPASYLRHLRLARRDMA